jgi:hypothetical protein
MEKIGRNDPCHCGSGKKYKRCHGQTSPPTTLQKSNSEGPYRAASVDKAGLDKPVINLGQMGLPGFDQAIVVEQIYKDPRDPRNKSGPVGQSGKYEVTLTLHRPGYPLAPETNASFGDGLVGDSHLAISRPAIADPTWTGTRIRINARHRGEDFVFEGTPNERGFLAKLVTVCTAATFLDAHRKAGSALNPAISNWSLTLDIPVAIYQTDVKELSTGGVRMTFTPPYPVASFFLIPSGELPRDLMGYASVYREALLSNSSTYQFLCYFKIIESIRSRRARIASERKAAGVPLANPFEKIPSERASLIRWLDAIFPVRPPAWDSMTVDSILLPEAAGKKFTYISDTIFADLRNNIAHALFEAGELTISIDDQLKMEAIHRWLPVARCMARRMLKNEFRGVVLAGLPDP